MQTTMQQITMQNKSASLKGKGDIKEWKIQDNQPRIVQNM